MISMVAYNWYLNIEILSRLFLLLCRLKMYDLMLYRLPLIMVIATAGCNTVQKCHPQRQHHETLLQLRICRHYDYYSKTCVRQPPLKLTLVVDEERWLSYKGTCHVILLAKLHDMYLCKTDNFFHIYHYLKSVSKVALLHRFYCISTC